MKSTADPWPDHAGSPADASPRAPIGVDHYETFPVGSVLLPRALRPAVFAIYHFARHADDIADEGDATVGERLAALDRLHRDLERAEGVADGTQPPIDPADRIPSVVERLIEPVQRHRLAWRHFHDLLDAFAQDLVVHRHVDAASVDHYCERSANPVGRLMLELFGVAAPANVAAGDAICSALQRINFLQDIAIDMAKDRIYMPLDTLAREAVDPAAWASMIAGGRLDAAARAVVAFECDRAATQMLAGLPLLTAVPLRLRWELRAIIAGGLRVLERIAAGGQDPVAARPVLGWRDGPALLRLLFRPAASSRTPRR